MAAEDLYGGFSLDDDAFGGVSGAVAAAGLQYGLGSLPTQAPPSANPSMAPIRGCVVRPLRAVRKVVGIRP